MASTRGHEQPIAAGRAAQQLGDRRPPAAMPAVSVAQKIQFTKGSASRPIGPVAQRARLPVRPISTQPSALTRVGKVSTGSVAGGTTAAPVRTSKQPSCQAQTSTPSRGSNPASDSGKSLCVQLFWTAKNSPRVADQDHRPAVDLDRDQLSVTQLRRGHASRAKRGGGRGRSRHPAAAGRRPAGVARSCPRSTSAAPRGRARSP